jgi:hypothetical protein
MVKQIEKQVTITFRWWTNSDKEIDPNHVEGLEKSAMTIISEMMNEGYTSGELNESLRMPDFDNKRHSKSLNADDAMYGYIDYQGYWDCKWLGENDKRL